MDEVDLHIMRRMGIAPFLVWPHPPASLKPTALARAVGTSTDTVKRRLAALRKAGVFHGTQVFPNPRLLGLRMASFHFRLGTAARRRVPPETVTKVAGVLGVFDMAGGDRCVDVAFAEAGERDALLGELTTLLGVESSHFVDYATPPPAAMTALDWRIIQALRQAPDASLEQAASRLGFSLRTVKRRFDRMAKDGCLDVIGLWDPGAIRGHLLVDLVFHFAPGAGKQELAAVLNAFRSRWVGQWSPPDQRLGQLALVVVADSARELEDLRREGESLPFVERCDALVLEAARENWEWLDEEILGRAGDARSAVETANPSGATLATARQQTAR